MFEILVKGSFSAAHWLRGYKGKCEGLHGHNWEVEITISAERINSTGMVMDFSEAKRYLKEVLDSMDHRCLNDMGYFRDVNPTSENIARYIYDRLVEKVSTEGVKISRVTVWETSTNCAVYKTDETENPCG